MQPFSCEIVADLLPLYAENVCSEQSRAAVEEHLKGCPACREKLAQMTRELPQAQIEQNISEGAAIEKLSKTWKSRTKLNVWASVLCIALYILIYPCFYLINYFHMVFTQNADFGAIHMYFVVIAAFFLLFGAFIAFLANRKKSSIKTVLLEAVIIDLPALCMAGSFFIMYSNFPTYGVLGWVQEFFYDNPINVTIVGCVLLGCEIYRLIFKRK